MIGPYTQQKYKIGGGSVLCEAFWTDAKLVSHKSGLVSSSLWLFVPFGS